MILRFRLNSPNRRKKRKKKATVPKSVQPFVESKLFFSSVSLYVNKLSVAITVVMLIHLSTMI